MKLISQDVSGKFRSIRYDNIEPPGTTPEYGSWEQARDRCRNPKNKRYALYGGRGIVFSQVFDDFKAFLLEVGPRPSPLHSLDRIDNDRGYEPGNVQWATASEQSNNRSSNRLLEFNGETLTLTEWARRTGLDFLCLRSRINRGWSAEEALTRPPRSRRALSR